LVVYGGAGNDIIRTGSGADIVIGGSGNDVISGNNGCDLLIGGADADSVTGNNAEDILIAGTTAYDADPAALNKVLAEWTSVRSYSDRIANIRGTQTDATIFAARLNGSIFLRAEMTGATVYDDGVADTLSGGNGSDWFLFNSDQGIPDVINDLKKNDTGTDINP
jgi:Ca2+-binding RTX toxin-like protein